MSTFPLPLLTARSRRGRHARRRHWHGLPQWVGLNSMDVLITQEPDVSMKMFYALSKAESEHTSQLFTEWFCYRSQQLQMGFSNCLEAGWIGFEPLQDLENVDSRMAKCWSSQYSKIHQRIWTIWLTICHSDYSCTNIFNSHYPQVCHHDVPLHPQVGAGEMSVQARLDLVTTTE